MQGERKYFFSFIKHSLNFAQTVEKKCQQLVILAHVGFKNFCTFYLNIFGIKEFFGINYNSTLVMRVVIQRVSEASVTVNNLTAGTIQKGLLILVGIEDADTEEDIAWLSNKIVNLRIFDDENNVPNISVKEIDGRYISC